MAKKSLNDLGKHAAEEFLGHVENVPVADDGTFRSFIENLPVMFYAVEPTPPHKPIYISPTFEEFGYPLDDWMNNSDMWDRIIHPDDRENVLSRTREAMRRGEGVDFEYRIVCKDESVV